MTELSEWTCEGDPKQQNAAVGVNGNPARYPVDTHHTARDKVGFAEQNQFGWYRRNIPVPSV